MRLRRVSELMRRRFVSPGPPSGYALLQRWIQPDRRGPASALAAPNSGRKLEHSRHTPRSSVKPDLHRLARLEWKRAVRKRQPAVKRT